jgi:CO dehydrogenase maturation factor
MKIAVSGKGGVGKTTVSSNLAKLFAQKGAKVYAVDADPDSSLGFALGIDPQALENQQPLIDLEDVIQERMGRGALYNINPSVEDIADGYGIQRGNICFLRMGSVKKGGTECYCRENLFLKSIVSSLILDSGDVVILDMGAGIEHLTRGTSSGVDLMLIVTEPGMSSVQTARVVERLAKEIGVEKIRFIANKVRSDTEEAFIRQHFNEQELLGIVRYDSVISDKGMGFGQTPDAVDNPELQRVLEKVVSGE